MLSQPARPALQTAKSLTWLKVNITVSEAESLLQTQDNIYTNVETGIDHLACEDYSLPAHLREHVDFITPTIHFDATVKPKKQRRDLEGRSMKVRPVTQIMPGHDVAPQPQVVYNLTNCYQYVTPDCLRALYGVPNGTLAL